MTYDRRNDPVDPVDPVDPSNPGAEPVHDETRVVERQTYVERERPAEPAYVPPAAQPAGSQVNVNADSRGGYADTVAPGPLYYVRRVVSLLFGILAVMIGLRILLLLFVANESNTIVDFIYGATEPFVAPFRGIFSFDVVNVGDARFDIAALVALIGWLLIYLLLMAILRLGDRGRTAV